MDYIVFIVGDVFEISVCNSQSCPVYNSYDYFGHVSGMRVVAFVKEALKPIFD